MAMGKMKAGKAVGPSEVSVEMIAASGEIGIDVMVELCQGVLDGRRMPDEWVLRIFKGKGMIDAVFILRRLQEENIEVVYVLR